MAKQSYNARRAALRLDDLLRTNYERFSAIPDPRNRVINQRLADVCQAGFALFHLKFPSLLDFDTATAPQVDNLRSVYGLDRVCSDTQMRRLLDQVDPSVFHQRISEIINTEFSHVGGPRQYEVFDRRLVVSLDGVEHFRSNRIHCSACLTKSTKKGVEYHHQLLCGSIVHPDESLVFPVVAEPIVRQDGEQKNDCERNAAKRVINYLTATYQSQKWLVVADGLYSCGPIIEQLLNADHDFIITAKPGDHQSLFKHFDTWRERGATTKMTKREGGLTHRFEWANRLNLNETWANLRLNVLHYEQVDRRGRKMQFSWVTNRRITRKNVYQIMRIGRSRWKVENETFNTLKNQGYHFEHNYGHGEKHLATGLAYLMFLAFLTDQLLELCSVDFQAILKAAKTRVKVWFSQRALFTTQQFDDFAGIHGKLAQLYGVQQI